MHLCICYLYTVRPLCLIAGLEAVMMYLEQKLESTRKQTKK